MIEKEKITFRDYCILCAIEDYIKLNSKYYCVSNKNGFFVYGDKRKRNKLFWFSEDKDGHLFFAYKVESKVITCNDDPVYKGFYIIKEYISGKNVITNQTQIKTQELRKRKKYFYDYLADFLNGKDIPKNNQNVDLLQMVRAYFFFCVFEETLLTNNKKLNFTKMIFYDKEFEYGCLNRNDAKYITEYYFCSQIYDCVKRYETIFNKTIITDVLYFKKSVVQMIDNGDVCLERCNGVNSSIILVPQKVADDIMSEFLKLK